MIDIVFRVPANSHIHWPTHTIMHAFNEEKQELGHIVLREPGEYISVFMLRDLMNHMYEPVGRNNVAFALDTHIFFQLNPFR
jgi:hypothetical protein